MEGIMQKKDLAAIGTKSFEELRKINEHGAEYWSARDLQPLLGYTQWRRFDNSGMTPGLLDEGGKI
jgi:DNA-damage-inducible protein D